MSRAAALIPSSFKHPSQQSSALSLVLKTEDLRVSGGAESPKSRYRLGSIIGVEDTPRVYSLLVDEQDKVLIVASDQLHQFAYLEDERVYQALSPLALSITTQLSEIKSERVAVVCGVQRIVKKPKSKDRDKGKGLDSEEGPESMQLALLQCPTPSHIPPNLADRGSVHPNHKEQKEVYIDPMVELLVSSSGAGDIRTVIAILDRDPSLINLHNHHKVTALYKAAHAGRTMMVQVLLTHPGIDIEVGRIARSPLHGILPRSRFFSVLKREEPV